VSDVMTMEWTLESMDISGVGKAPSVCFTMASDGMSMSASPPGGHIHVEADSLRGDDEFRSRITLTNTLTGSVYADVVARHVSAGELPAEWNDATMYAGELACSLYWSMWRMQQLKAKAAGMEAVG
jgi:hypothetical protein